LELLGYKALLLKNNRSSKFLNDCIIVDLNEEIKKMAIAIKQKHSVKLPDSIIAATALYLEIPLLTADKDLKGW